jgi:hypothetical protein
MKNRIIVILCSIVLCSLLLAACSGKTGVQQSSTTAKDFLNRLYTVDSQTVQNFNISVPVVPKSDSLGVYIASESKAIMKINQKFQSFFTESEYSAFISNCTYLNYVKTCKDKGVVIAPVKIQITQTSHDKTVDQYDYTASFKITFDRDNHSETKNDIGQISLIKDNDTWKVNYIRILKSDFY